jgi:signal transduction histidine kinase/GAF domain-containing protein/HAMP domain-containing protein
MDALTAMYHNFRWKLGATHVLLILLLILGAVALFFSQRQLRSALMLLDPVGHSILEQGLVQGRLDRFLEDAQLAALAADAAVLHSYERSNRNLGELAEALAIFNDAAGNELAGRIHALLRQSEAMLATAPGVQREEQLAQLRAAGATLRQDVAAYALAQQNQARQLDQMLDRHGQFMQFVVAAALLLALAILVLLVLLNAALLRPLRYLDGMMRSVENGQYDLAEPTVTRAELGPFARIVDVMGVTLRGHRAALDDQLRRTSLLMQLAFELRETLDPAEIIEKVLRVISSNLGISNASIILVTPRGDLDLLCDFRDGVIKLMDRERARRVLDNGLAGWVLRRNRSVVLTDVRQDERWTRCAPEHDQGSAVVVPIRQHREPQCVGVLTVHHHEPGYFSNRDLVLMEGVVAQADVALAAARHYQEERRRRDQAMALFAMSQFLTAERSYADLAMMIHEKSRAVFQAEYGLLYLKRQSGDAVPVLVGRLPAAPISPMMAECTAALAQRACREAEVATEGCRRDDIDYACVALPLKQHGTVFGAYLMVHINRGEASYSASVWSLLTIFANVIATTCANMHLITQLRQHADSLEVQVRERTAELLRSRDLLRLVFDNLPEGLLLLDTDGCLLAANNAFGHGIVGRTPRSIVGWHYDRLWNDLAEHADLYLEPQGMPLRPERAGDIVECKRVLCTDTVGQQRWYVVERTAIDRSDSVPERYLERWRDVTQQEELQRRLIIHEQMTSLGRLAASVVHEVGNPLQSVVGCLELCREDPALPARSGEYLAMAQDELERMGRTLERLRDLYRPPQYRWHAIDLAGLLVEVQRLTLRQFRRHNVVLELRLAPNLPPVYGQADALRQVFLNLVLNAQEAMPDGGSIQVCGEYQALADQCRIEIRDSGIGIPADQLERIFEPFHSQKAQGVGLGLYLCRQIIEQHGGTISVESVPQVGTTFTVMVLAGMPEEDDDVRD